MLTNLYNILSNMNNIIPIKLPTINNLLVNNYSNINSDNELIELIINSINKRIEIYNKFVIISYNLSYIIYRYNIFNNTNYNYNSFLLDDYTSNIPELPNNLNDYENIDTSILNNNYSYNSIIEILVDRVNIYNDFINISNNISIYIYNYKPSLYNSYINNNSNNSISSN